MAALARIALRKVPSTFPKPGPKLRKVEPETARPFLKWVGGKHKLLPQLAPLMPDDVGSRRHVEPFIGGGAMFFARAPKQALIADLNPSLIGTYQAIRDELDVVVGHLQVLKENHNKELYYARRERYNTTSLSRAERAALFIYLNRTCFNGLHRVNRKGEFNVPMGSYKNPKILNLPGLRAARRALMGAEIKCAGFDALLTNAKKGDFIYLDPPYAPVSESANFTSYAKDGFSHEDQTRLRDVFAELDRRGCKMMLSNSDVPSIRELYADFNIHQIFAARAINSNAQRRGKVPEVVVTNY